MIPVSQFKDGIICKSVELNEDNSFLVTLQNKEGTFKFITENPLEPGVKYQLVFRKYE